VLRYLQAVPFDRSDPDNQWGPYFQYTPEDQFVQSYLCSRWGPFDQDQWDQYILLSQKGLYDQSHQCSSPFLPDLLGQCDHWHRLNRQDPYCLLDPLRLLVLCDRSRQYLQLYPPVL